MRSNEVTLKGIYLLTDFTSTTRISTNHGFQLSYRPDDNSVYFIGNESVDTNYDAMSVTEKIFTIYAVSLSDFITTKIVTLPGNMNWFNVSPDHKYILGMNMSGDLYLYTIATGEQKIIKQSIVKWEGDYRSPDID